MCLSIWVGYVLSLLILISSFIVSTIEYCERRRFEDIEIAPVHISWASLKQINLSLWMLILIFLLFFSSLFTFFVVGSDILQNTGFYNSPQTASNYMSIPFLVVILMNPCFSMLQEFHGRALTFVLIGALATSIPFFCLLANAYGIFCFPSIFNQ